MDKALVYKILFLYITCVLNFFLIVATPICFPPRCLRIKVSCVKGNPFLRILEYSTPRLKFQTQFSISNFIGANFSCWNLRITSFGCQLGYSLGLDITGYYYGVLIFDFPCLGYCSFPFLGNYMNGEMVKW